MNENNTAIKDARSLGLPKMLLLGLQHMFAMFGATILVPILVNTYFEGQGLSIQVTLMCAGLGTLFFHACSKFKVPAFLGSSFAFLGGFATVANLNTGISADMTMGEKLPYACGGIVVAGALYLILALIIKLAGVEQANIVKLARHALSAAGCDRSDHYLYRSFTGAVRDRQRIDKLADCVDRAGNYHRF